MIDIPIPLKDDPAWICHGGHPSPGYESLSVCDIRTERLFISRTEESNRGKDTGTAGERCCGQAHEQGKSRICVFCPTAPERHIALRRYRPVGRLFEMGCRWQARGRWRQILARGRAGIITVEVIGTRRVRRPRLVRGKTVSRQWRSGMTAYILLAVVFEKRDLVANFGRR
jgi:hypothetical protein